MLCNEINPKRAKILSRNIERMAVSNALVTNEHPATLAQRFAGFFDRVLVDAPCSGEGMFHREPKMIEYWGKTRSGRIRSNSETAYSVWKPYVKAGRETPLFDLYVF